MSRFSVSDPISRVRRARTLRGQRPSADALLDFYLALLDTQSPLRDLPMIPEWVSQTLSSDPSEVPRLRLERLPVDALTVPLVSFCRAIGPLAPDPIARAAAAAETAVDQTRATLLNALLRGDDFEDESRALGCELLPALFLARAFLQPIAEAMASRVVHQAGDAPEGTCPGCGWPPQASILNDEPEAQGNRRLVCALCAVSWSFSRSTCPACGVSGEEGLEFHVDDEGLSHVRVDSCRTCRHYLKSVDLRVAGFADPFVDDLATPELDLWAAERGLEKIMPNLLGM